jgi:hypothetical protein
MLIEFPRASSRVPGPVPIASKLHLAGLLALLFATAAAPVGAAQAKQLADSSDTIGIYLGGLLLDWILFLYCYVGVRVRGGSLASISGDRWHSARDVLAARRAEGRGRY